MADAILNHSGKPCPLRAARKLFSVGLNQARHAKGSDIPQEIARLLEEINTRSINAALAIDATSDIDESNAHSILEMTVEHMARTDEKFEELAGLVLVALEMIQPAEAAHA